MVQEEQSLKTNNTLFGILLIVGGVFLIVGTFAVMLLNLFPQILTMTTCKDARNPEYQASVRVGCGFIEFSIVMFFISDVIFFIAALFSITVGVVQFFTFQHYKLISLSLSVTLLVLFVLNISFSLFIFFIELIVAFVLLAGNQFQKGLGNALLIISIIGIIVLVVVLLFPTLFVIFTVIQKSLYFLVEDQEENDDVKVPEVVTEPVVVQENEQPIKTLEEKEQPIKTQDEKEKPTKNQDTNEENFE